MLATMVSSSARAPVYTWSWLQYNSSEAHVDIRVLRYRLARRASRIICTCTEHEMETFYWTLSWVVCNHFAGSAVRRVDLKNGSPSSMVSRKRESMERSVRCERPASEIYSDFSAPSEFFRVVCSVVYFLCAFRPIRSFAFSWWNKQLWLGRNNNLWFGDCISCTLCRID